MIRGVAFKKTFSYAGFEQQPKSFVNPKVLCLNVELELKAEKDNAEVRVNEVSVSIDRGIGGFSRIGLLNIWGHVHSIDRNTKPSLTPSGRSSTGNSTPSSRPAPKSSSRVSPSATWPLSTLPTGTSFVPDGWQTTT